MICDLVKGEIDESIFFYALICSEQVYNTQRYRVIKAKAIKGILDWVPTILICLVAYGNFSNNAMGITIVHMITRVDRIISQREEDNCMFDIS